MSQTVGFNILNDKLPGLGIAYVVTTLIGGFLFQYVRRIKNIPGYLKSNFTVFKQNNKLSIIATIIYYILLFVPLTLLLVWVIILGVRFGPNPSLPILFNGLFAFGLFIPSESKIFYIKILFLFIFFILAQILAMTLSWNVINSAFFCLTALLLTVNGIFVSISLWLMDGSCWNIPSALTPKLKNQVRKTIQIWKQQNQPPYLIDGGLYYSICSKQITRIIIIISLYVLSLAVLLAYSLTVYHRTSFVYLGLINSVFVVSTDAIIYILINITKQYNTNPIVNCAAGIIVRVCLIAFSGSLWFIGYCLLYLLLMTYVSLLIIDKNYPKFQKAPTLAIQKTNIFKLPQFAGLLLVCMFGGLIYYIGNNNSNANLPILQVTINSIVYPFWVIGIASILLSFSILFYLISLRIVDRSINKIRSISLYYMGCEFCGEYYFFLFFAWGFLVALGVFIYFRVGNSLIWVSCVFLPLFVQSFLIFYANWVENDYLLIGDIQMFNKKLKKKQDRVKKIEEKRKSVIKHIKQQGNQLGQNSKINLMEQAEVQSNFMIDKNQRSEYQDWKEKGVVQALKENLMLPTDKRIIFSIPFMVIALVAYSIAYYFIQTQHTAFTVSVEILFLFLTIIPMKRYFSTLEKPLLSQILFFVIGIIINYAYGILCLTLKWNDSVVWTLWWAIINVFLLSLYATFSLLRDLGICIASIVTAIVSALLSFGVGIILLAAYSMISEGIVMLGVALYYSYILGIYFIYLHMNKSIPRIIYPISIGIIMVTCFAIMIYAFIVDTFDDFYGFTITYEVINAMIFLFGCYLLFNDIRDRFDCPNFYSPYGSPIFKYDPQVSSVKKNLKPLMAWLGGLWMFYGYTLLMQIFIADVFVGISTSMIFLILSFLTFIYFSTYNSYHTGKIAKDITQEILQTSWEEVMTASLSQSTEPPKINDLILSLDKYRSMNEGKPKVNPEQSPGQLYRPPQHLDFIIHDLQDKLQKAIEDQKILLINFWTKIVFKCDTIRKKKMLQFTNFIRQSQDFLSSLGATILLENDIYDLQVVYNKAFIEYNTLSPIQKIQFDKQFKQWKVKKEEIAKMNQQLNKKHAEAEKKRQEQLRKKLDQGDVDDSDQPIQKMRDSPLKLSKIMSGKQIYSDPLFRASNDIIPENARSQCKGWARPAPDSQLIKDQSLAMSVRQGYLGNCYLISAIGVLKRQHIQDILGLKHWKNPNGAYMVKFTKFGKDVFVIIDSQFPIGSDKSWLMGRCEDPKEVFTNVIQKAYAKLHGGYQNIVGGKVSRALAEMTGGFPQQIKLKDYQQQNTNQIFDKMIEFKKLGYLMGVGSPQNAQGDAVNIDGIVQGHAYLILDVRNLDGNRIIKLRNPHGNQGLQSKLDWSDDSPKWTKRLLNLLGQQMKQDGAFWIGIEDFVYVFRALYVCRIFDPNLWKMKGPINGQWKGKTAAGLPTKKNPQANLANNPHYGIKVSKKCTLFVQLNQYESNNQGGGKNFIFFMVQKNDGRRTHAFSANKLIGKSGSPINSKGVSAEVILNAQSYPYTFTLMVAAMDEGNEGTYSLTFYCDDQSIQIIPDQEYDK